MKEVQFILERIDGNLVRDIQNLKHWESKKKILVFVLNRFLKDYKNDYLELTEIQKREILEKSEYLKLKPVNHSESKPKVTLDWVKKRFKEIKDRQERGH